MIASRRPDRGSFTGPPPAGDTSAADAPAPSDVGVSDVFAPGEFPSGVESGFAAGAPALPVETGSAPAGPGATGPRRSTTRPIATDKALGDRVAAVTLLSLMGAAVWWLGGRPARAPCLLGGAAAGDAPVTHAVEVPARVGCIGRFSRPRSAPPNRF